MDENRRKVFSVLVVMSLVGIISEKNIKIVATRCHILKLKCTKFDFGWGSARDSAVRAYSPEQTPQLDLNGAYF